MVDDEHLTPPPETLGRAEARILAALRALPARAADLGRALFDDSTRAYAPLRRLVARGLVERDGARYRLTARGRARAAEGD